MSRFSLLYLDRGRPQADSVRFRKRLGAFVEQNRRIPGSSYSPGQDSADDIVKSIQRNLGVDVPSYASKWGIHWQIPKFFEEAELRDVLDAVTLVYAEFSDKGWKTRATAWIQHVDVVLQAENLHYRIDSKGVMHPYVDAEFEGNRASALAALAGPRFPEAQGEFEAALRHLRNGDGKEAIRSMFAAVESAAKVLNPGRIKNFGPPEIERFLKPRLGQKHDGNTPAISAGGQLLESFKSWVNASHPYRHGQETERVAEPPAEFVVAHLSAGASFLRWMVELSE